MNWFSKSVFNHRLPWFAVIAALAGVGVSWGAYAMVGGETPATHTDLPAQAVSHFDFCTSPSPGVNTAASTLIARVDAAAKGLRSGHERMQALEAARGAKTTVPFNEPGTTVACPGGFPGLPNTEALKANSGVNAGAKSAPSPYQVHIFVVSDAEMAASPAGAAGYIRTAYELSCEKDVCAEASTALYVSESVANDPARMQRAMEAGVGWDQILSPQYPDGHPASEPRVK